MLGLDQSEDSTADWRLYSVKREVSRRYICTLAQFGPIIVAAILVTAPAGAAAIAAEARSISALSGAFSIDESERHRMVAQAIGILAITAAATIVLRPRLGAIGTFPMLLAPALVMVTYERSRCSHDQIDFRTWFAVFFLTGSIGLAAVLILQLAVAYPTAYVLFGSDHTAYLTEFTKSESDVKAMTPEQKAKRRQLAWTWQNVVFLLIMAFALAGLLEETLRYLVVMCVRHYRTGTPLTEHEYVAYTVAAGLGFSTVENIGFIHSATGQSGAIVALTVLERVGIGSAMHGLGSVLIGLRMAKSNALSTLSGAIAVIWLPVVIHGCFDFFLMGVSAWHGNVGWVHPRDTFSLVLVVALALSIIAVLVNLVQLEAQGLGHR